MSIALGMRLGAYEVHAPIGAGGMGEVYRALDTKLGREVALKVLPPLFAGDPDRRARFAREAHVLASLNHPNIAAIHGIEEAEDITALVLELVEGPTLADRIAHGPLPIDETLKIARQIADALDAAHERGIVHRDLKPANIKVTDEGRVKVLDFGLAKALTGDTSPDASLSPTMTAMASRLGVIVGTAAYMSPEQAKGKAVDKRTDIWAFGCVLFEMLTGQRAFPGEDAADFIAAVLTKEPDWSRLPAITPRRVVQLVQRCLRKDRRERLRDVGDALVELSDPSSSDVAVSQQKHAGSPMATKRRSIALMLLITAGIVLGVAVGSRWGTGTPPAPQRWLGTRLGGPLTVLRPRLSPDGQLVAFLTFVDGMTQVGVMKPASGNWTVLTHDRGRGYSDWLSWSSDSSRIYFDRWTDTPKGVYAVPALGGEERLILEDAANPSTLPDGTLLVQRINANRQNQYFKLRPATGRVEALPALASTALTPMVPLANGRETVFYGRPTEAANVGLYLLNLDSGNVRLVADDSLLPRDQILNPLGLAAGRDDSILVAAPQGDGFQLYALSTNKVGPPSPSLSFPLHPQTLDVGPDSSLYVGLAERPVAAEWVAGQGGSRSQAIVTSPMFTNGALVPLPDGRALITSRAAGRSRVLAIAPGKEPVPFLETDEETNAPITAVGIDMAAVAVGPRTNREIAIASLSSGRVIRKLGGGIARATAMAASPDGRTLYYATAGNIWAISREGSNERKLCPGDSVTVDPDSGDLIVKLDEPDRYRLQRLQPTGGTPREIPVDNALHFGTGRPLLAGAVRAGKLVFPAAATDSWFNPIGVLDLNTGRTSVFLARADADFHSAAWTADGNILTAAVGIRSTLWRYQRVSPGRD